jgi:hypothetical protein
LPIRTSNSPVCGGTTPLLATTSITSVAKPIELNMLPQMDLDLTAGFVSVLMFSPI